MQHFDVVEAVCPQAIDEALHHRGGLIVGHERGDTVVGGEDQRETVMAQQLRHVLIAAGTRREGLEVFVEPAVNRIGVYGHEVIMPHMFAGARRSGRNGVLSSSPSSPMPRASSGTLGAVSSGVSPLVARSVPGRRVRVERSRKRSSSTGKGRMSVEFFRRRPRPRFAAGAVAAPPLLRHHLGGLGKLLGRLQLAIGGDDASPSLPLGLGLPRDRPLHRVGQHDILDLDAVDVDAPAQRGAVDQQLEALIEPLQFESRSSRLLLPMIERSEVCATCAIADM